MPRGFSVYFGLSVASTVPASIASRCYTADGSKKFRTLGLKMLIVSESYHISELQGNAGRSAYDGNLCVLKDAAYGINYPEPAKSFIRRCRRGGNIAGRADKRIWAFKSDQLIDNGLSVSERIVDSLMNNNK